MSAQRDGNGPANLRGDRHDHRRDGQRGGEGETHGKEGDRPNVAPQIARRKEESGRKENRWQQQRQHDLGLRFDARQARQETDAEAGDDHQDRIRHTDASGQQRDRRDYGEQKQDELEGFHWREA